MNVVYLDESIGDVSKLEILLMRHSYVSMEMPFESIAKLTELKALVLNFFPKITNSIVPDDICDLKYIRHLEMSFTYDIEYFPFDCIAQSWTDLSFFQFEVFPQVQQFSNQFLQLPKLETVILDSCNFDQSYFEFDTFDGFSPTLEKVSLNGNNDICYGSIIIDNTTYYGFEHLHNKHGMAIFDTKDVTNDELELLDFIRTFDPCNPPCTDGTIVCFFVFFCAFTMYYVINNIPYA